MSRLKLLQDLIIKMALALTMSVVVISDQCFGQPQFHQTLSFGLHSGIYRSRTLTQWLKQYNENNEPDLKRKLYNFGPSVGYELSYNSIFDMGGLTLFVPFKHNYGRSHVKAKFNDGTERHLELRRHGFLMSIGAGGTHADEKTLAGVYFSVAFGYNQYELGSYFKYRDGTESYGDDKLLNGVYRNSDVKIGGDFTFLFCYKKVGFNFNVSFLSSFFSIERQMTDNLTGNSLFLQNNGQNVISKFNDFNLSLGINYRLNSLK